MNSKIISLGVKIIMLMLFLAFWIANVSASYESLDKFKFSESEYKKIVKEKILTSSKLEKTFPKYKWISKKLDEKIYKKLGTLGMQARRDYLKKSYIEFYNKYEKVNDSNASASKKNLAKLVFKYMMLENYVMYYRNK